MATKKSKSTETKQVLGYGEPNCKACKLQGQRVEEGWGCEGADTMVIFSHPAQRSKFLAKVLLPLAEYQDTECWFTYVCSCPRGKDAKGKEQQPTGTMIKACSARLDAEIAWHDPATVILLGKTAQVAILPNHPVARFHGKVVELDDRLYVPMYDPIDADESPYLNDLLIADFKFLPRQEPVQLLTGDYRFSRVAESIVPQGMVTVDTETVNLYGRLLGGAVCLEPGVACYYTHQSIVEVLNNTLFPHLLFHNAKYDMLVLFDNEWEGNYVEVDDTQLLAYCMAYDALRLKVLETQELSLMHSDYDHMVEGGTLADLPEARVAEYCCGDADSTRRLWDYLVENADDRELKLYNTIEKPLLPALVAMERLGIQTDVAYVAEWEAKLEVRLAAALTQVCDNYSITPDVLSSPKKLGDWLVSEGIKLPKTGSSGQAATGKEILSGLKDKHPAILDILRWRQTAKLKSTYADACRDLADENGVVHTRYNQTKVITGRLSSYEPNLQNLPYLFEARRPFIARPGNKLLRIDYSQIDMRALAALSQDPQLLKAFEDDEDIHNWMSDILFGDHNAMHRHVVKSASYLSLYGGSASGLHKYLNSPMGEFDLDKMGTPPSKQECQEIIDTYYRRFEGIALYHEKTKAFASAHGYVEDWWGRRRYIPKLSSPNPRIYASGEREAINMPIAGTAANIFKLSIVAVYPIRVPVLNVHDELVFDVPESEVDYWKPKLVDAMQGLDFPVPLVVECQIGDNLGELI